MLTVIPANCHPVQIIYTYLHAAIEATNQARDQQVCSRHWQCCKWQTTFYTYYAIIKSIKRNVIDTLYTSLHYNGSLITTSRDMIFNSILQYQSMTLWLVSKAVNNNMTIGSTWNSAIFSQAIGTLITEIYRSIGRSIAVYRKRIKVINLWRTANCWSGIKRNEIL